MKAHTDAYFLFKRQVEDLFHFVVVICYAMPSLKRQIKAIREGKTTPSRLRPDFFITDKRSIEKIQEHIPGYRSKLSSYAFLSVFSFFEAYVNSAVREIIDFHGGDAEFIALAERRAKQLMSSQTLEIQESKRKLQEPIKPAKSKKYEKYSKRLTKAGYRFPSELLSVYGVRMLTKKTNRLRASEIPILLQDCFQMKLSDNTVETFHSIRQERNKIAHGKKARVSLKKIMEMNNYLHSLAVKIDQHLVEHFLVIEKYAD